MKRYLSSLLLAGLALGGWLAQAGAAAAEEVPEGAGRKSVLVVFEARERHIDKVAGARAEIAAAGGQVRAVLGLAAIYAEIEPGSERDLAKLPGVARILDKKVGDVPEGDYQLEAAYAAFNKLLEGPQPWPEGEEPRDPPLEAEDAPDLPKSPEQQAQVEADYKRYWDKEKRLLPEELQRSGEVGCSITTGGYYDTSLYLSGDVAVGIFYKTGDVLWTPATMSSTFASIVAALDFFVTAEPTAQLTFVFSNEVDAFGNQLPLPTNERTYDNNLRNIWCTDWAYMISVQDGGVWPNAYVLGPSLRLDRGFGWFDYTVQHESGHIFGARDQYGSAAPSGRWGYLQASHGNGCGNDGTGYFGLAGECQEDLMNGWVYNNKRGPFTAGQLGWHDNDGDGLLDLRETKPIVVAGSVSHTAANPPVYSGTVKDRAVLDELPGATYGDVSVEKIAMVEYSIGNSAWQEAQPTDGIWDSALESFAFTPPPLKNGTYTVKIRARNTAGAVTPIVYQETLSISGSAVTNTRPFPALAVNPARAMLGTNFVATAAGSNDFETPSSGLSYQWWLNGSYVTTTTTTTWNVAPITFAGTYVVMVKVIDGGSLVTTRSKTIKVESYNTAPSVKLKVTPERRFGTGPGYSVSASLSGTTDAETPFSGLMVWWDLDGDGAYESSGLGDLSQSLSFPANMYPFSERRFVRAKVSDGINTTIAERKIWIIPYDHRPTMPVSGQITFVPAGPNVIATAHASDVDTSPWDAMLEYRWDYEGDGIWDTEYLPSNTVTVAAGYASTLAVEVKDRFHALVGYKPLIILEPDPHLPK